MAAEHDWIWYELMTPDPHAAAKFYSDVVGWRVEQFPGPEGASLYLVGKVGDRGVVGMMGMPPTAPAGMPPNWSGYVRAQNTDETAREIADAGGRLVFGPFDIPQVGWIAVVSDPEGGMFNLLQPAGTDAPPLPDQWTPGSVSWSELHSDDPEKNFAWYQKLFGWRPGVLHDMGPGGGYQEFTTNEQRSTGGSCGKMGAGQPTHWLFYFAVDGIDAATERAKQGGASFFMDPHEVPGGTWITIGRDPQGAVFALYSQRR